MQLTDAAKAVHGEHHGRDVPFQGLSRDTRTLNPGDWYIALKGPNFNGHDFLPQAIQAGATAAILSDNIPSTIPTIQVKDTRQALLDLAAYHRDQFKIPIIAVTGSCGKTTCKMMLANVFAQVGNTHANESSYNNDIGVPLTLLGIKPSHQFAISEMGANHAGEISLLTNLVKPNVAIITVAAEAHLEGFGSLEGVAHAKSEIFEGLPDDGVAVINQDDRFADIWKELAAPHRIVTFGIKNKADVMASSIVLNAQAQPGFRLHIAAQVCDIQLPLMGEHNVINALAVAAAAHSLDVPIESIKKGLESGAAVKSRLVEQVGQAGAVVIDDSYNANPLSVTAAMQVLVSRAGQSVLVLGDMGELGEDAQQLHSDLGVSAKQMGIDRLYCFGELSRHTVESFGDNGFFYDNQDDLIRAVKKALSDEVTVLVKGSNSMNMSRVAQALVEQ